VSKACYFYYLTGGEFPIRIRAIKQPSFEAMKDGQTLHKCARCGTLIEGMALHCDDCREEVGEPVEKYYSPMGNEKRERG